MREIKFRGLNGTKTKWIYATLDNITKLFQHNGVWKETVGQFTGLHDKNGVEIYEGDIVEVHEPFNIPQVAKVKFNDGCFDVIGITLTFRDYLKCFVANRAIEVIGNIHERSEDNDKYYGISK